jgi:hypothetical protein
LHEIFAFKVNSEKEQMELAIKRVLENPTFDRIKLNGYIRTKEIDEFSSDPLKDYALNVSIRVIPKSDYSVYLTIIPSSFLKKIMFALRWSLVNFRMRLADSIESTVFLHSKAVRSEISSKISYMPKLWYKKAPRNSPFVYLLIQYISSQFELLCIFFAMLALFLGCSFLDMLPALLLFLFALLQNAQVGNGFWNFLKVYVIFVACLKYFAQLDIFCTTSKGVWHLSPSNDCIYTDSSYSDALYYRTDFLFGVYKIPENLISSFIPYFFLLSVLSFLKQDLKCKGLWDRNSYDLNHIPIKTYFSKFMKRLNIPKRSIKAGYLELIRVKILNFIRRFILLLPDRIVFYFYSLVPVTVRGTIERRLKPGLNYYSYYTYIQIFCVFYSFFLFSLMTGATKSITSFSSNYFSGDMVLFVFSLVNLVFFFNFTSVLIFF